MVERRQVTHVVTGHSGRSKRARVVRARKNLELGLDRLRALTAKVSDAADLAEKAVERKSKD